jgi:ATP-dependent Clp protease ATP-binding subunit ClpC
LREARARWDAAVVFGGFTVEACNAVSVAEEEAAQMGRGYVGVEHILLGLLRGENGVAAQVLTSLGITLGSARERLLMLVPPGAEQKPPDAHGPSPFVRVGRRVLEVPFTERAKLVLELAVREALTLGSSSIETEHILLGISGETESVAMRILIELDAELPHAGEETRPDRAVELEIRNAVVRHLSAQG